MYNYFLQCYVVKVGSVVKEYNGFIKEVFTDADTYVPVSKKNSQQSTDDVHPKLEEWS